MFNLSENRKYLRSIKKKKVGQCLLPNSLVLVQSLGPIRQNPQSYPLAFNMSTQ